jgi:lysophospholipase L1-like esterase
MHFAHVREIRRRSVIAGFLVTVMTNLISGCGGGNGDIATSNPTARAAWTSPQANALQDLSAFSIPLPLTSFENTTMRLPSTVSVQSDRYRIKLSNVFGTGDVSISKVVVAKQTNANAIDPATNVNVTFNGSSSVTIPKGSEIWSDPARISLQANDTLSTSFFLNGASAATTGNMSGKVSYASGDQTTAASLAGGTASTFGYILAEVDAYNPSVNKVLVSLGDSITAGTGGGGTSYPSQLQSRISNTAGLSGSISVVNQGIPGNRLLFDGFGPSAVSRFDRDVLGVSGLTDAIIFMGINDIQLNSVFPSQTVDANQVISALDGLVQKAKQNKLTIFLGTITPFKGSIYYSADREAVRQTVNAWIRNNKDVKAVFDFDAVMRSSADPVALDPSLDSGDHLHPNAAGYEKMAAAIDLAMI